LFPRNRKQLASLISDKAPMRDYLKALLNGDHRGAAKAAWKKGTRRQNQ